MMIYCPRCAAQNAESAKFCRSCGTDISLVTEALTGSMTSVKTKPIGKYKKEPTIEKAMETLFVGLAFLLIVFGGAIFFTGGFMMWIWFIIPALTLIGSGIGQWMSLKQKQQAQMTNSTSLPPLSSARSNDFALNAPTTQQLAAHGEKLHDEQMRRENLAPPFSVTDGTTRLFDQIPEPVNKQTEN